MNKSPNSNAQKIIQKSIKPFQTQLKLPLETKQKSLNNILSSRQQFKPTIPIKFTNNSQNSTLVRKGWPQQPTQARKLNVSPNQENKENININNIILNQKIICSQFNERKCENCPDKKGKYFLKTEDKIIYFCSKCSIQLIQNGVKLNEVRSEKDSSLSFFKTHDKNPMTSPTEKPRLNQTAQINEQFLKNIRNNESFPPQQENMQHKIVITEDEYNFRELEINQFIINATDLYNQIKDLELRINQGKKYINRIYQDQQKSIIDNFNVIAKQIETSKNQSLKSLKSQHHQVFEFYTQKEQSVKQILIAQNEIQNGINQNLTNLLTTIQTDDFNQIINQFKQNMQSHYQFIQNFQEEQLPILQIQNQQLQQNIIEQLPELFNEFFSYEQQTVFALNPQETTRLSPLKKQKQANSLHQESVFVSFDNKEFFQNPVQNSIQKHQRANLDEKVIQVDVLTQNDHEICDPIYIQNQNVCLPNDHPQMYFYQTEVGGYKTSLQKSKSQLTFMNQQQPQAEAYQSPQYYQKPKINQTLHVNNSHHYEQIQGQEENFQRSRANSNNNTNIGSPLIQCTKQQELLPKQQELSAKQSEISTTGSNKYQNLLAKINNNQSQTQIFYQNIIKTDPELQNLISLQNNTEESDQILKQKTFQRNLFQQKQMIQTEN